MQAHFVLCNAGVIMFGQNQFRHGHATAGAVLTWICLTAPAKSVGCRGTVTWRRAGHLEGCGVFAQQAKTTASQNAFPGLVYAN
jgi:hypothetical protein